MAYNINFNEQTGKHSFFSYGYAKFCITVTGYFQNVRRYKDDEAKVKSLLLGGTAQLRTQSAFNLCEEFSIHGAGALSLN